MQVFPSFKGAGPMISMPPMSVKSRASEQAVQGLDELGELGEHQHKRNCPPNDTPETNDPAILSMLWPPKRSPQVCAINKWSKLPRPRVPRSREQGWPLMQVFWFVFGPITVSMPTETEKSEACKQGPGTNEHQHRLYWPPDADIRLLWNSSNWIAMPKWPALSRAWGIRPSAERRGTIAGTEQVSRIANFPGGSPLNVISKAHDLPERHVWSCSRGEGPRIWRDPKSVNANWSSALQVRLAHQHRRYSPPAADKRTSVDVANMTELADGSAIKLEIWEPEKISGTPRGMPEAPHVSRTAIKLSLGISSSSREQVYPLTHVKVSTKEAGPTSKTLPTSTRKSSTMLQPKIALHQQRRYCPQLWPKSSPNSKWN